MSLLTKAALVVSLSLVSHGVFADGLCKEGLIGVTLIAGSYNPPETLAPDEEVLKPNSKWPDELVKQGWHNLRKDERPLRLVCRYGNGKSETIVLPESTDACLLRPGLRMQCTQ